MYRYDSYIACVVEDLKKIPYFGEKVEVYEDAIYNSLGEEIGVPFSYAEDMDYLMDDIFVLRESGVIPNNNINDDDLVLQLDAQDITDYAVHKGTVIYSKEDVIVLYMGQLDAPEDNEEYYEEEWEWEEEECTCMMAPAEEREEKTNMENIFGSNGFGKITSDRFKLSMNGIAALQSSGKYVVYNKDNNEFVDVSNMLFDMKNMLFALPAVEVNVGDTVIHEGKAYYIVENSKEIKAVSYEDCTQTVLIPKSTMFGIKYFTKVFSMFGDNFGKTKDIFSNPMMLMALMDGKNSDLANIMLMSSMTNNNIGSNPMALAMMLKGDKSDDTLSNLALMSMFNNGSNPFTMDNKKKND